MTQKLSLKICILFLTLFLFSCKHQLFLKRKYTDGFFSGGISKKEKISHRISKKTDSVNYAIEKSSNDFIAKADSDSGNLAQYITNDSYETDLVFNQNIVLQINHNENIDKSFIQKSTRDSYIETDKPNFFDFKTIGSISLIGSSLISLGLFSRKKNMKQISKWAYRNKWKTKFLIAGATISNLCASIVIGDLIRQNDIVLPDHLMEYAASAFGLSIMMYPRKKNILFDKKTYLKRKLVHLSLASLSCIMTIVSSYNQKPCIKFVKQVLPEVVSFNPTSKSLNDIQIIRAKTELAKSDTVKPAEENKMKWWQILTIFFIILTSIVSTLAIMFLSCYLSCSGQGGLATLVGVGGTALLIALSIYSIVKIREIKIDPKKPKTQNG